MKLPRLSAANCNDLAPQVQRPGYVRGVATHGIVHLGIGAFHRAHQAVYTDDAVAASGQQWGITGVSLRSSSVAEQLNPQDGLYTVAFRSAAQTRHRLIGAERQVLVAPDQPEAVIAAIATPRTHIVSFTVTEKGYCRDAGGQLDLAMAGEHSLFRYLRDGLAARQRAGLPGLTLLCCDNLAGNGHQLDRLLTQYLEVTAPDLTRWYQDHCTTPSTMVDRIVPASTDADLQAQAAAIGLQDDAAVFTEEFTQWVVEDRFAGPRPQWEAGGAQFTHDVHAWETAKLRMLNGAHSALAYLGLARGHEFVHEAIADPHLRALIDHLMREEAASSLTPTAGLDLEAYADELIARFANPALRHRLLQISMDGSQKIPQRWLQTLAFHQKGGRSCPAILTALAAWMRFVRGDRWTVDDPRAAELATLWKTQDAGGMVDALFGAQGLFASSWVASRADRTALLMFLGGTPVAAR